MGAFDFLKNFLKKSRGKNGKEGPCAAAEKKEEQGPSSDLIFEEFSAIQKNAVSIAYSHAGQALAPGKSRSAAGRTFRRGSSGRISKGRTSITSSKTVRSPFWRSSILPKSRLSTKTTFCPQRACCISFMTRKRSAGGSTPRTRGARGSCITTATSARCRRRSFRTIFRRNIAFPSSASFFRPQGIARLGGIRP